MAANVFWPYFNGISILLLGVWCARRELQNRTWTGKAIALGPALFAAPMAVFGAEHLTAANVLAQMVPRWMPAHVFWAYFVGVALVSAAVSLGVNSLRSVSSTLLGGMILLFVLLIHLPGFAANPTDLRLLTVLLRDLAFGSVAIAFGTSQTPNGLTIVRIARCIVSVSFLFFGWQYFPHPELAPVTPLGLKTPAWIPFEWLWSYGIAAALIVGGAMLLANRHARIVSVALGIVIFAAVLFVYVPILAARPGDIGIAMNYVADTLAIGGEALLLASLMPQSPLYDEERWRRRPATAYVR